MGVLAVFFLPGAGASVAGAVLSGAGAASGAGVAGAASGVAAGAGVAGVMAGSDGGTGVVWTGAAGGVCCDMATPDTPSNAVPIVPRITVFIFTLGSPTHLTSPGFAGPTA